MTIERLPVLRKRVSHCLPAVSSGISSVNFQVCLLDITQQLIRELLKSSMKCFLCLKRKIIICNKHLKSGEITLPTKIKPRIMNWKPILLFSVPISLGINLAFSQSNVSELGSEVDNHPKKSFALEGKDEPKKEIANADPGKPESGVLKMEDPEKFFRAFVSKKPSPRGDFETSKDYEARLLTAGRPNDLFFFPVDRDNRRRLMYKYNPDTKQFSVKVVEFNLWPSSKIKELVVFERSQLIRQYLATNGFGAQTTVTVTSVSKCVIPTLNLDAIPSKFSGTDCLTVNFKASPDEARKIAEQGLAVIGVRFLGFNRCSKKFSNSFSTFSNPYDYEYETYSIDAMLDSIQIIDKGSKMPFFKWSFASAQEAKEPRKKSKSN
jgi:hypothetical protein